MIFVRGFILAALAFFLNGIQVIAGQCIGVRTISLSAGESGSIKSPNYPFSYGRNEDCKWRILAPYGQKVLIYFTALSLEDCCSCDVVKIYNGYSESWNNLLTKGCGSSLPPPVYSSSRYVYITFVSDGSVQGNGFVAHYKALNSSSGCPIINSFATAGVIYSPNFPWYYPNYASCNWTITVPSWKKIKLNFTYFALQSSFYCSRDYVTVRDSYYYTKTLCGNTLPSSITRSGSIYVTFRSDYWISYQGFMAFYQIAYSFPTPSPVVPTQYITYPYYTTRSPSASLYGVCTPYSQKTMFVGRYTSSYIASPTYKNIYYSVASGTTCSWQIDTEKGFILKLTFDRMSITSCSSGCTCGYVKVYDGSSSRSSMLGTFCNGYSSTVTSNNNHIFIKYYGYYSFDSFRASVSSKKGRTVNTTAIVVPLVIAVVLFTIIVVVIKCTKIKRCSPGPAGLSNANDFPLQPLHHSTGTAQPLTVLAPPPPMQSSSQNAEVAPPSDQDPSPIVSAAPLLSSSDYPQGVDNLAMTGETAQL